jgi:cytochrome P450
MTNNASTLLRIPLVWYRQMHDTAPVSYDSRMGIWQVFRYDDALHVLTDPATFSSEPATGSRQPRLPSILGMDEPRHHRLRSIVARAFTPRSVTELAPRITEITNGLLDTVLPRGEMDVIADLAYPLPITVIAILLGVPPEERDTFRAWSTRLVSGPRTTTQPEQEQAEVALTLRRFLAQKLEEHRRQPREDLMSRLLEAEVDGEKLSQEELLDFCQLLLIAGYETAANLIGNALVSFEDHPEAVEELRHSPELMSSAVEEILRCYPSVSGATRLTTTATVLGGQSIDHQQTVAIHIASANYDERQFPDPDHFLIRRDPNKHLAFGSGIHFCLGAPLARLEATIALQILLERFQQIERIPDAPVKAIQTFFTFGVEQFPVTFKTKSVH